MNEKTSHYQCSDNDEIKQSLHYQTSVNSGNKLPWNIQRENKVRCVKNKRKDQV